MFFCLGDSGHVDERTLHDTFFKASALLHNFDLGGQFFNEGIVDTVLHKEAIGADAGLAGIAVFRCNCAFDSGINVGIVKDDEWRIAAEFEADFFDG